MKGTIRALVGVGFALAVGCGDDEGQVVDAAAPDVAVADAAVPDVAVVDAAAPDVAVADAAAPDSSAPDAAGPDAVAPDAAVPDAAVPDAAVVDAAVFDGGPDAATAACGANVRVTNNPGSSSEPVAVWNGAGYGLTWTDTSDGNSEIYFARLDPAGAMIGGGLRVTDDAAASEGQSVVFTGSEYGVVWYDQRDGNYEIYFARVDAAGAKIGGDVRVTNDPATSWGCSLAWSGTEYGIAWWENRDGTDEVYFARLDAGGVKIGADVRVTVGADASSPVIAWNGAGYGLAWGDYRDGGSSELYFARVDAAGTKIGGDVRVTNASGASGLPSLAWNGAGYGLGWEDSRGGAQQLWFVVLDAAGAELSPETALAPHLFAPWQTVWTGSGYGLGWSDSRDGNLEIYFATVDSAGVRATPDLRVTTDPATSRATSVAWNGADFGVVWGDSRDGNTEVYFARVCP